MSVYRGAILTDLDNTLYNWVDYFAPSFRAMVHVLARQTRAPEQQIIHEFRAVFARHGSVEYAFSVQELELCREMSEAQIAELIRLTKGAFSRVRENRLATYPGVKETLEWALTNGLAVVGVTNAAMFPAQRRLQQLRIDHLFTGLAAASDFAIPHDDPWTQTIRDRSLNEGWPTKVGQVWTFNADDLKPSGTMYARVVDDLNLQSRNVWVVGDSLHKDVAPALKLGLVGVWARYGSLFDPKNFETLLAITDWSGDRIATTYSSDSVLPDFTIDSFSDLRPHIPPLQAPLFMQP